MKRWVILAGFLLVAAPADAHLVASGLGPAYDGALHFLLSPDEVLAISALALLAGLRGPASSRAVFFALPAAWLAGAAIDRAPSPNVQSALVAASLLALGAMLAANTAVPPTAFALMGLLIGIWHASADGLGALPTIGSAITSAMLAALVTSLALPLKSLWSRTIPRVLGSWIAALGLLLVGWRLHTR